MKKPLLCNHPGMQIKKFLYRLSTCKLNFECDIDLIRKHEQTHIHTLSYISPSMFYIWLEWVLTNGMTWLASEHLPHISEYTWAILKYIIGVCYLCTLKHPTSFIKGTQKNTSVIVNLAINCTLCVCIYVHMYVLYVCICICMC